MSMGKEKKERVMKNQELKYWGGDEMWQKQQMKRFQAEWSSWGGRLINTEEPNWDSRILQPKGRMSDNDLMHKEQNTRD